MSLKLIRIPAEVMGNGPVSTTGVSNTHNKENPSVLASATPWAPDIDPNTIERPATKQPDPAVLEIMQMTLQAFAQLKPVPIQYANQGKNNEDADSDDEDDDNNDNDNANANNVDEQVNAWRGLPNIPLPAEARPDEPVQMVPDQPVQNDLHEPEMPRVAAPPARAAAVPPARAAAVPPARVVAAPPARAAAVPPARVVAAPPARAAVRPQFEIEPTKIVNAPHAHVTNADIEKFNRQNVQERQDAFWAMTQNANNNWLRAAEDRHVEQHIPAENIGMFILYWEWLIAMLNWKINDFTVNMREDKQYLMVGNTDHSLAFCSHIVASGRDTYENFLNYTDIDSINGVLSSPGDTFVDVHGRLRTYACAVQFACDKDE